VRPDFKVPDIEIGRRNSKIQTALQDAGFDGLFIVQHVDRFYFTGTTLEGIYYIPSKGEALMFVFVPYGATANDSPELRSVPIRSVDEIPGIIFEIYGHMPSRIGFEFDVIPVNRLEMYRNLFASSTCLDGSDCIRNARAVKSDWEVSQMEKTGRLFREMFEYASSVIRPGLSEMVFAGMMESFAGEMSPAASVKVRDIHTEGYPWHILSGTNGGRLGLLDSPSSGAGTSAAFPCGAGPRRLKTNEPIMIDFAFEMNGYHMDVTRMFSMGKMPPDVMRVCEGAIEIHNETLERVKPGVTADELFRHSEIVAERLGLSESYLGPPGKKVSFVGHGIGLELVEGPFIARGRNDRLEPGMTFALEPKMVFEGKFAAGVESVFVVTDNGHRLISQVPVKVFVC